MAGLEAMGNWLNARLFLTNFRPVPLTEHAVFAGTVYKKVSPCCAIVLHNATETTPAYVHYIRCPCQAHYSDRLTSLQDITCSITDPWLVVTPAVRTQMPGDPALGLVPVRDLSSSASRDTVWLAPAACDATQVRSAEFATNSLCQTLRVAGELLAIKAP